MNHARGIWLLAVFGFLAAVPSAGAAEARSFAAARNSIRAADLKRHVAVLASDALEGRDAGSRGGRAAAAYLLTELRKLRVKPAAADGTFYQEFGREFRNVLAIVPGSDPAVRDEIIVVGAHYDHVGYGLRTNSYGPLGQIHNGADDNASGTAGLLELIEAVLSLDQAPRRTILFAFWDAEEDDLLGSRHWVAHPTRPLNHVRLMINVDMIGRLRHDTLDATGVRTGTGLRWLASRSNRETDLRLNFRPGIASDSDHWPFFEAGIPILYFETGEHEDYHRPSDDAHRLVWDGAERVTRFLFQLIMEAAEAETLPRFRPDDSEEAAVVSPARRPAPPRLGISWDAERAKQGEIRLTEIAPRSPAERAGLRVGDRLLELGPWKNGTQADLWTTVLVARNPVRIVVERAGQRVPVRAELAGEPLRLGLSWRLDPAEPGCAIVTDVVPHSPCDRADVRPLDRIAQVGTKTFESSEELRELLISEPDPVELLVERDGRILTRTIHLVSPE